MHEYGIVQTLIQRATQEAAVRHATRVDRLTVSIGELSGVEPDLLVLAWETFREQAAILSAAELILETVPAKWVCPRCEAPIGEGTLLRCADCNQPGRLEQGDGLVLQRIEMEIPDVH